MAHDKDPNHFLAKLSIYWAKQNNKGNPVESAIHLLSHRRFKIVNMAAILLYAAMTAIWRPHMFTVSDNPSVWLRIWIVLVGVWFIHVISCWDSEDGTSWNAMFGDAEHFITAISALEEVLGKPIEQWTDADNIEEKASACLKKKAAAVKTAEEIERAEAERKPWANVDPQKTSWPHRHAFESSFGLLTKLLPLPKDKGIYYGNKATDTTEAPATS